MSVVRGGHRFKCYWRQRVHSVRARIVRAGCSIAIVLAVCGRLVCCLPGFVAVRAVPAGFLLQRRQRVVVHADGGRLLSTAGGSDEQPAVPERYLPICRLARILFAVRGRHLF